MLLVRRVLDERNRFVSGFIDHREIHLARVLKPVVVVTVGASLVVTRVRRELRLRHSISIVGFVGLVLIDVSLVVELVLNVRRSGVRRNALVVPTLNHLLLERDNPHRAMAVLLLEDSLSLLLLLGHILLQSALLGS